MSICRNCRRRLASKTDFIGTYWWHVRGGTVWCYSQTDVPPEKRHLRATPQSPGSADFPAHTP